MVSSKSVRAKPKCETGHGSLNRLIRVLHDPKMDNHPAAQARELGLPMAILPLTLNFPGSATLGFGYAAFVG